jgi:primosomal replication protein N
MRVRTVRMAKKKATVVRYQVLVESSSGVVAVTSPLSFSSAWASHELLRDPGSSLPVLRSGARLSIVVLKSEPLGVGGQQGLFS